MPTAYHRHPEFGFLCPSSGLRRTAKVALVVSVLATVAAASQIVVQIADRSEPSASDSSAIAAIPFDPYRDPVPANIASPAAPPASANAQPVSPRSAPSVSPRSAPLEASASMTIKPPQTQVLATPKKPRKAARSQTRRRDRDPYDDYAPRRRDRDEYDAYAFRRRGGSFGPRDYGYSYFWRPGW
jgi:hypothetical protein